jgi:hypothetical protein
MIQRITKRATIAILLCLLAPPGCAPARPPAPPPASAPAPSPPPEEPELINPAKGKQPATAGPESDSDLAQRYHDEARRLIDEEKWGEARAQLLKALELKKSYDILANLGLVELELNQPVDAATHLLMAQQLFPTVVADDLTRKVGQTIDDLLGKARKQVGAVWLGVEEKGATLLVDGKEVGASPLRHEIFLTAGNHRFEAKLDGRTSGLVTKAVPLGEAIKIDLELGATGPTDPDAPAGESDVPIALPIVSAILGVGGIAVGAATWVLADGKHEDADAISSRIPGDACAPPLTRGFEADCSELVDSRAAGKDLRKGSIAAFTLGAVFLVTSGVLFTYHFLSRPSPGPAVAIDVSLHGGLGAAGLRFDASW